MSAALLLLRLAVRNIVMHRMKTAGVSIIVAFVALVMVVAMAMLSTMGATMRESLIGAVTGHLQVYSAAAKNKLTVAGSLSFADKDVGGMDNFDEVREAILSLPAVAAVAPMGGADLAYIVSPGPLELAVEDLRQVVAGGETDHLQLAVERVQDLTRVLERELTPIENGGPRGAPDDREGDALADVHRALTREFWAGFEQAPEPALDYLENRVLPRGADANRIFVGFLGVDFQTFERAFPRLRVIKGSRVPPGAPGLLVNERIYETTFKHAMARVFDELRTAIVDDGRRIAGDAELESKVLALRELAHEVALELTRVQRQAVERALRAHLRSRAGGLDDLLAELVRVDDESFARAYRFFYEQVSPHLDLYRVAIGQDVVIRYMPTNALPNGVKLPLYGTFEFHGINGSPVALTYSLVDMNSMRSLIGLSTPEQEEEYAALRQEAGVAPLDKEAVEARIFGVVAPAAGAPAQPAGRRLRSPLVPFAAVVLKNGDLVEPAREAILALARDRGLGIQVKTWKEVSGTAMGMISIFWLVASITLLALLLISVVVITNTVVMTVLERVPEIGTLRAMGAGRGFQRALVTTEVVLIGLFAGALGDGLGLGVLSFIGERGIPAGTSEILQFVFGGERLHPRPETWQLVAAPVTTALTAALAASHPARMATRIQPVEAMREGA